MTQHPLKTVLIGFGKVAAGFIKDPLLTQHYKYATHAQVLQDHPLFEWGAVVDSSSNNLDWAKKEWKVPRVSKNIEEILTDYKPDVAILATPPDQRMEFLGKIHSIKGVLIEKPLASNLAEAHDLIAVCQKRNIQVQVNYWRRADRLSRELAEGKLRGLIGKPQSVFGVYGNGLYNNGSHMIDFARMLFGEVEFARAVGHPLSKLKAPKNDIHVPFNLQFKNQLTATFHPIDFNNYRENCLEIWGNKARLSLMQEGLGNYLYPLKDNRAIQGEKEIASDTYTTLETTVGDAFYHMYNNLGQAVLNGETLWSPALSALKTEEILQAIVNSAKENTWRLTQTS